MNIKKTGLAIACAIGGAAFLGSNAYAAPLTVKIDDADFYSALKTCVNEGMSYTELWLNGGEVGAINNMGCGSFEGATFDDSTTSITFADEADINNVGYLYMPNMGIKNIQDLSKFPQVRDINLAHNDIEDATVPGWDAAYAEEVDLSIVLSDNKLKEVPAYITDVQSLEDKMDFFTMKGIDQKLVGDYSDGSYQLPESLIQYREALVEYSALASNFSDGSYAHDVASYYAPDNWLVLENATLSSDGRSISPINPSRNMVISYKKSWNDLTTNSPMFKLCDYAENADLCDGADMQAYIDYQKSYYNAFQSSSDELRLITLTVYTNNASEYGDDAEVIRIEDPTFYEAVKDCIRNHSVTMDEISSLSYDETLTFTHCIGLDDALFNDSERAIIFEDGDDFKFRTKAVIIPNANITSVNDAFKFSYFTVSDAYNSYLTDFALTDGDAQFVGNMSKEDVIVLLNSMYLFGNKIEDIDFDAIKKSIRDTAAEICELDPASCRGGAEYHMLEETFRYMPRLFEMAFVNQDIEKEYSGEKYKLPKTVVSVAKYLQHAGSIYREYAENYAQNEQEREQALRIADEFEDYYDINKWLVIENATLSDDGEYLIPIDPTRDMSISYRRDWADMETMNNTVGSGDYYGYVAHPIEVLQTYENNDEYHNLVSLKVRYVAPNPNTSDNSFKYLVATSSAITLAGAVIYAKTRR